MDIGEWWQSVLTNNELSKIRASQVPQMAAMTKSDAFNREVLAFIKTMYGGLSGRLENSEGNAALPRQYSAMVNLFRRGGQFGEGGRAEARRGAQQALATGQLGMATTGMSSGTNVAGLGARVAADEALARKKIEDQRVQLLGGALESAGGATLTARQIAQQKTLALLQTLGQIRPGFVSY